jgi:hypothetical protein
MPAHWNGQVSRLNSVSDSFDDTDVLVIGAGFVAPATAIHSNSTSRSNRTVLALDAGRRWPSLDQMKNVEYVFVGKERHRNE